MNQEIRDRTFGIRFDTGGFLYSTPLSIRAKKALMRAAPFGVLLLTALSAWSQEPTPIRVDVGLVTLTATVTSPKLTHVGGLQKQDFMLYENGDPQDIAVFQSEDVPISLGILFDTSGSMEDEIDDVQDAVLHFTKTINPQDEIFVLRFNDDVDLVASFTGDRGQVSKAVRHLRARGSTHLYDAIAEGLEIVRRGRYQKKALLLITDGNDTASSVTLEEVLRSAQRSEVLLYALGVGHRPF